MTNSNDSEGTSDDERIVGDWKQADERELKEKIQEGARKAKESNKKKIQNPEMDEEHGIFKKVSVEFRYKYEVISDADENDDLLQYESEERLEDGEPIGDYYCLCGAHSMSEKEAIQHINSF